MSTGELIAYGIGLTALLLWLRWAAYSIKRWWRNTWRRFKHTVARAPIDVPVWLWRRFCLLGVPGWISARDFYQTPEWDKAAQANKAAYDYKCAYCDITNKELPSGSALESHHMRKRLQAPHLALTQSNLVALCPHHHRLVERGKIKLKWNACTKRWGPT